MFYWIKFEQYKKFKEICVRWVGKLIQKLKRDQSEDKMILSTQLQQKHHLYYKSITLKAQWCMFLFGTKLQAS